MTNQEVADELQHAIDLIKQDGKDWLDERDIPILEAAIKALEQPEIIRCKDCRHWHREIDNGIEYFNYSSCDLKNRGDGHNFYCADAERKDDGENISE